MLLGHYHCNKGLIVRSLNVFFEIASFYETLEPTCRDLIYSVSKTSDYASTLQSYNSYLRSPDSKHANIMISLEGQGQSPSPTDWLKSATWSVFEIDCLSSAVGRSRQRLEALKEGSWTYPPVRNRAGSFDKGNSEGADQVLHRICSTQVMQVGCICTYDCRPVLPSFYFDTRVPNYYLYP